MFVEWHVLDVAWCQSLTISTGIEHTNMRAERFEHQPSDLESDALPLRHTPNYCFHTGRIKEAKNSSAAAKKDRPQLLPETPRVFWFVKSKQPMDATCKISGGQGCLVHVRYAWHMLCKHLP